MGTAARQKNGLRVRVTVGGRRSDRAALRARSPHRGRGL